MKLFTLILILASFNVFAGDEIMPLLRTLKENLNEHQPVAPVISKLIEKNFNFNYAFYFDDRNDHFGVQSNEMKVLAHHLMESYLDSKESSPDLAAQIAVVVKQTDRGALDNFVLFNGIGTYNLLDAAAYSCNTDLMKEIYKFVSASYTAQTYLANKRLTPLSAAYSGGCFETTKFLLEEAAVYPWDDKCDFLKPPFKFKNKRSEQIDAYLNERYEIEDYSSCLRKIRFKGDLNAVGETEMDMLKTLFELAEKNEGANFLEAVQYILNKYGYSFPWNALVNGETIINKIVPLAFEKKTTPANFNIGEKKDEAFNKALGLILNYNDSAYPLLNRADGEYNTFLLLAEQCSLADADFNVGRPNYQGIKYKTKSGSKTILHVLVQNNCSYAMKMDHENMLDVLETGCSIFQVPNYNSDSLIGRYFLETYGFDDYKSCQNSLKKGYEFRIKKGLIP